MAVEEITRDMLMRAIGMADAAKLMSLERGRPPHRMTVLKWTHDGWRPAPGAPAIVLKSFRKSRDMLTLPEWVEQFERERAASLTARPEGVCA